MAWVPSSHRSHTFLARSLYRYAIRGDLSRVGSFMFTTFLGMIIAGLANMFLVSSALRLNISTSGVTLFRRAEAQRIKEICLVKYSAMVAPAKESLRARLRSTSSISWS
jgi:FtsH-binding integral membrane protein